MMNNTLRKHLRAALLLLAIMTPTIPAAQASGAIVHQIRGDLASAELYVSAGCGYRQVNLSVADVVAKEGHEKRTGEILLTVFISEFDPCHETASIYDGSTTLTSEEYSQTRLSKASLAKTLQVCGPNDCKNLDIDLHWTGVGESTTDRDVDKQDLPGVMYVSRVSGSSRPATVSGTVSDGLFDYASGDVKGSLSQVTSGSITIQR